MNKQSLFKAIRQGEVALWVGAGFSRYAGFPSGEQIVKNIYYSLSEEEKQLLSPQLPLPSFAEKCVNLRNGNKNNLLRLIVDQFKKPISLKYHEMLAKMPFIDTIITTNYDELFELAYGRENINKVASYNDLPFIDKNKTTLYKIHGELQNPVSMIVSEGDFRKFYTNYNDMLWRVVESVMTTKTLVFLGYSLDDQNVLSMFEYILQSFPSTMREAYLVAPNMSRLKQNELLRKNVVYIDSTGEDFVEDLMQDIKDNLFKDVKIGLASGDKARAMLQNMGLNPVMKADNNGFAIEGLHKNDGTYESRINFSIKSTSASVNELMKMRDGDFIGAVEIPHEDLVNLDIYTEGFKMAVDLQALYIASTPSVDRVVDIIFDDGSAFLDVHVLVFKTEKRVKIIAKYKHVSLVFETEDNLRIEPISVSFRVEHEDKKFKSVNIEKEIYSIVQKLASGMSFKAEVDGNSLYSTSFASKEVLEYANYMLEYFSFLVDIERHFKIIFKDMDMGSDYWSEARELSNIINNKTIKVDLTGDYSVSAAEYKRVISDGRGDKGRKFLITHKKYQKNIYEIYGREFIIEFCIILLALDGVFSKVKGDKNNYSLKSKSMKGQLTYEYPPTDKPPFGIPVHS